MAAHEGCVVQAAKPAADGSSRPEWIDLQPESASLSTPIILGGETSSQVRTGLWRTQRPVVDYAHCRHCTWICATLCPDGAIAVGAEHEPIIDYEHCKGCLLCAAVCPSHAIRIEPECAVVPPESVEEAT
jgi:pyruvate ferredoxin oxidoreductase gamma subunit